ncbi:MAG: DUF2600 family protein [Solirubrobacteraceae bacterium]
MLGPCRSRLAQANAFAACSLAYWLHVFPHAHREIRRWRRRAEAVPDGRLRELALTTQRSERGNLEGAAAFAVLAPPQRRIAVARAAIAFQAAYDFVDTLAEQPCEDPEGKARRLHLVLLAALDERHTPARGPRCEDPSAGELSRSGLGGADGGYLQAMTAACRASLCMLPSYPLVRAACLRATERMIGYQGLTHAGASRRVAMRSWAQGLLAPAGELSWWESAAGAASSLSVFALIAASARPGLCAQEVDALEHAYFPRVGALHVLLDSLVDKAADERSGHHSLVSHYPSAGARAERLAMLARTARADLRALPGGGRHEALLAAMVCFYLSSCDTTVGRTRAKVAEQADARHAILAQTGPLATAAMTVLRLRRALAT